MKLWLPDFLYKTFPLIVSAIGFLGCLAGTAGAVVLGGMLIVYGGGVLYLRWG